MSTVVEIESALRELPEREAWQVAGWLQEYLSEKWNRQIDEDIAAGRLDRLADYRAGQVKWMEEKTGWEFCGR